MFVAKTLTIVLGILVAVVGIIAAASRSKDESDEHIEVTVLNDQYDETSLSIKSIIMGKDELKKTEKELKAKKKAEKKSGSPEDESRIFVLEFEGDIKASAVENLREEITAILMVARKQDEVFIKLQSPGGMVTTYGLAASQLKRIRDHGLKLTASVDQVAASGGYMMACVADHIIAAPFSIIGSIGVVAQMPNFSRLLKKHDIDYELITAGEYKRTLTMFGENTDEGRLKFKEDIEDIHVLFKDFVSHQRPVVDIKKVSTGEYWFGTRALELSLVDELKTSDDYLLEKVKDSKLYKVEHRKKKKLSERFSGLLQVIMDKSLNVWWTKTRENQLP